MPKRKQGAVEAAATAESIDPVMRAKQRMKELAMKIGLEGRDLKPYVSWRGSIWRFSEFVSRKLMHSSHIKRLDIEMRWFSPFLGRPFKRNCCRFYSAVFFDQTVGMAVAYSNQGESNWFRDHRSLAEKPRCQVAWTGERWVDEWMSEIFMAFFPWWTTETPSCLFTYIDDEGVDYRGSTCHPITSSEDFGDTEIHTPKAILEYVWIPQYPWISLNLNSQLTFLGAGPNSIILSI